MASDVKLGRASSRRGVARAGAGALTVLAGLGLPRIVVGQEATPTSANRDLNGYYGVTRHYIVADDADIDELIAKVDGFLEIISQAPGFAVYCVLLDDPPVNWTAISIFDNPESAQASTEAAAEYVAANDLGGYFVDPNPEVVTGTVIVNAGF